MIRALVLAADGTAYVAGETRSADFPVTPEAYDTTYNGGGDGFGAGLNPSGSALVYSTFLGGDHGDHCYGIALGPVGTAYVTGWTQSRDFPTTPGAFDETFNGGNNDLFVTRLDPTGSDLEFSTYIGGNDSDDGAALAVGAGGEIFIVGDTNSVDYPTTPGAYDTTINSFIYTDAIVTVLAPDGSDLLYSTFLGGADYDTGVDLVLEGDGAVSLVGSTQSPNFPTTPGSYDRTLGGTGDAFVARFDPTGSDLLYSSFLGGTDHVVEYGHAIAPAGPGVVTVAGRTASKDFPTTPGAYDRTYNGGGDLYVATLRVARAVHVDAIVPAYREVGTGYRVGAAIRIVDFRGSPVEEAAVTVEVDAPGGVKTEVTRTTGQGGIAAITGLTRQTGTYTFTVLDVAEPRSVYDPTQNAETTDSITIP
jgi:hypothetical protein